MRKEWPSDWEEKEQRAFNLLQWNPYSLPTDFNWELAALGHYTKLQTERSDKALDEFDSINERQASEELAAFHELERLGVYTQADYFSPTKAKEGFYARRLREHTTHTARAARNHSAVHEAPRPRRKRRALRNPNF